MGHEDREREYRNWVDESGTFALRWLASGKWDHATGDGMKNMERNGMRLGVWVPIMGFRGVFIVNTAEYIMSHVGLCLAACLGNLLFIFLGLNGGRCQSKWLFGLKLLVLVAGPLSILPLAT